MTAINKPVSITPLVRFRIAFGLLMFASLIRFWYRGWIETIYITPSFHFSYSGFEWVRSLGNPGMYILFSVVIISSLLIALGLFYRIASVLFFIGFTYIELIDVTTYLNHYYFISLIAFLMIWLPANRKFSGDVYFKMVRSSAVVPAWTVNIIRFQLAVVYIFAGLAKLNYDWLIEAQPMKTWLPAKSHLPVIGAIRPSFLKISQHFGTGFETDSTKMKIVMNLQALANDFNCEMILEGIEQKATADFAAAPMHSGANSTGRPSNPASAPDTGFKLYFGLTCPLGRPRCDARTTAAPCSSA